MGCRVCLKRHTHEAHLQFLARRCTLMTMRETQAIIERVRRVSAELLQLELSVDPGLIEIKPGQSVYAWVLENTTWTPYLREQWIPVSVRAPHALTVEFVPEHDYAPGQVVSLLSPVGKPIPVRENSSRVLLIAENVYPTPFVMLARQLVNNEKAVTLVLSERALHYPLELLPPEVEILRRDTDWKWPEQVETLNWADQVILLAPAMMQATVYGNLFEAIRQLRQHQIPDGYICGLFYPRLACGTGACQACQIPGNDHADWLACSDGPALDLKKVAFA